MAEPLRIGSNQLRAAIAPLGAQLQRLTAADGSELLWDGDPAWWAGRAPLLFPVIGELAGGVYHLAGKAWPMARHGFARQQLFVVADQTANAVTFRLEDNAATRAHYPFAFALSVAFRIDGATLAVTATISNRDTASLPASFGFHPAFRWPLGDADRADYRLTFDKPEPHAIRRIDANGLLLPEPEPSPVEGDALHLRDALFMRDAVIFDRLDSRRLRYGADTGPALDIAFPDSPMLGVWTKPGAPYICIEPWQGLADPIGFTGDFHTKPGVIEIAPGAARQFRMTVTLNDA